MCTCGFGALSPLLQLEESGEREHETLFSM